MLLTITNHKPPATDIGYLLHKHPDRLQSVDISAGRALIFYPEATEERCTAALLMELDPVGLVRNRRGPKGEGGLLQQYVNDRPYVASSFLSVAIREAFSTAMGGRCKDRPELAKTPLPLEARLPVIPCYRGEDFLRSLFEPLGYEVKACRDVLDPQFPEWGESHYFDLTLKGEVTLQALLNHLYVLIPVLDNDKHYWVGAEEIEKLLRRGSGWLETHPEKETIIARYLRHQRSLTREALARLLEEEDPAREEAEKSSAAQEASLEKPLSLNRQRIDAARKAVIESGARRVIDLGCGGGKLIRELLREQSLEAVAGMDVSVRALERASGRLKLDRMPDREKDRVTLFQGSLMYRDRRLEAYDTAVVMEVIEHFDPPRLSAFERVVFGAAKPGTVIVTTPNIEYNVRFDGLPPGALRHPDHRFEWTRREFTEWATGIGGRYGYTFETRGIGETDLEAGEPTQMAVFRRSGTESGSEA